MSANMETMFYVRHTPWHGLGTRVEEAPNSEKALEISGIDWLVFQNPIYTQDRTLIPNYKANIRNTDNHILGVVTDRYQIVQNYEAFAFTDSLLGEGVRYETAGSLQGGRKVWLLAKLPENYIIGGEKIMPYLVFSNSHDGSAAIKVAMTPIRVVCQNTLNLALKDASRSWSAKHTSNINSRMHEARETLELAHLYMENLGKEINNLNKIKLPDDKAIELINELVPLADDATAIQQKNINHLGEDIKLRYFEAPDLKLLDKNGYRFINAISDHATHVKPLRETKSYQDNLFLKTIEGNPLIDKAYALIKSAA